MYRLSIQSVLLPFLLLSLKANADICGHLFSNLTVLEVSEKVPWDKSEEPWIDYTYQINGENHRVRFNQTDRGYLFLAPMFRAQEILPENLVGKKIVDIGSGRGRFVFDLIERGAIARGVDGFLLPHLKSDDVVKSILAKRKEDIHKYKERNFDFAPNLQFPIFLEANMIHLPIDSDSVDIVTSAVVFHYEMPRELVRKAFFEILRILKPGGVFLIQPISNKYLPILDEMGRSTLLNIVIAESGSHSSTAIVYKK